MKHYFLFIFLSLMVSSAKAQNAVGIGTTSPNASAKLDVRATNAGVLIPRMSSAQRTAITLPANGLLVYDSTVNSFWFYKTGIGWTEISTGVSSSAYWTGLGNDLFNLNSAGVGIGPVAVTPLRSKLEVYDNAATTNAIFGNNFDGAGVSIKASAPGIAFNLYNTPNKRLGAGYGGLLDLNQNTGNFSYYGADSGVADGVATNTLRFRISKTGNIGIQGNTSPGNPLSFINAVGNKIDLMGAASAASASYGLGTAANQLLFYVPTSTQSMLWGTGNSTSFTEQMRLTGSGTLGIGTSTPNTSYKLDVNGRMRLRHNGVTAGLWFNKSTNTEASFLGQMNDSVLGIFDATNWNNWVLRFDHKNSNLGIGFTTPQYPLSFEDFTGDKISLYGGNTNKTNNHYGLGIQGYTFQLFVPDNTAHFSFGYGRSAAFTELARLEGNGQFLIGINSSTYQNHFRGNNARMLVLDNTATHSVGAENALSFKTGGRYEALVKTIATSTSSSRLGFFTYSSTLESNLQERLSITDGGDVLIGTTNETAGTGYKLRVNGKVICTELRVQTQGLWPDYVFDKDYKLMSLPELKKYLLSEKHLPNIPSAAEVSAQGGIDAGDMQKRLTEKVEELTLYILDLQKQIDELKSK